MRLFTLVATFLGSAHSATIIKQNAAATDKTMFCYYTNWSQYREDGGKFFPANIPADLCTHLLFAFGYVDETSNGWNIVPFEWNDQDTQWSSGLYTQMNQLKQKNPSLKTLLAVGGWNHGNIPFSKMVATDQGIKEFSRNSLRYVKKYGFDGLDLDWEYPAKCTVDCSPLGDEMRFKKLYGQIRHDIDTDPEFSGLLLTIAVGIGLDKIYETYDDTGMTLPPSYDPVDMSEKLDWIHLMLYDMHGHWENVTSHQAMAHAYTADDRICCSFCIELSLLSSLEAVNGDFEAVDCRLFGCHIKFLGVYG